MASLADMIKKLKSQNFGENDSLLASSLAHPVDAAGLAGRWLQNQVNTAAGTGIPYDEANPFYTNTDDRVQAGFNLAGLANVSGMPFAPKSNGATLGTVLKPMSSTLAKDHEIARINAAKPISEGGLGLPETNTSIDRANALDYHLDDQYGYYVKKRNDQELEDMAESRGFHDLDSYLTSLAEQEEKIGRPFFGYRVMNENPNTGVAPNLKEGAAIKNSYNFGDSFENTEKLSGVSTLSSRYDGFNIEDANKYIDNLEPYIHKDYPRPRVFVSGTRAYEGNDIGEDVISNAKILAHLDGIRKPNAAFDPLKRNTANLLASVLAGTAIAKEYKDKKPSLADKIKGK